MSQECCPTDILIDERARNELTFYLINQDQEGVETPKDISWAVSGRLTIFDPEADTAYLVQTTGFTITAEESKVVLVILSTSVTDIEWSELTKYRIDLIDTDGEPRKQLYGKVTVIPCPPGA